MPNLPKLILKADDYGDMAPANDAINELVARGLLTSVGVMVGFAKEKDVRDLLEAIRRSPDPGLVSVVLHTNFQTGRPLSPSEDVPSLVDEQGLFKRPRPDQRSWDRYAGSLKSADVEKEIDAQIRRFVALFGRYPDALDSHNIILAVPPVAVIAMDRAKRLGIALTYPYLYADRYDDVLAAQRLNPGLLQSYKERSISTVDYAYPRYFNCYKYPIPALLRAISALRPGVTQIVFHPVHPKFASIATDSAARYSRRLLDYTILTDPKVMAAIALLRERGQLTSFKQLR